MPELNVNIYTDASTRPKFERSGIGGWVQDCQTGEILYEFSIEVPFTRGTNLLEYTAVIYAVEWCLSQEEITRILIHTDSAVVAGHLLGAYGVKDPVLKEKYTYLLSLLGNFSQWNIKHIDREFNGHADKLAGDASGRNSYRASKGSQ